MSSEKSHEIARAQEEEGARDVGDVQKMCGRCSGDVRVGCFGSRVGQLRCVRLCVAAHSVDACSQLAAADKHAPRTPNTLP